MRPYERTSILVPDTVYFDANTLAYWAAGRAGSADPQDHAAHANVDALTEGDDSLYLSPLTLLELNSTLYKLVRKTEEPHAGFGAQDAADAEQQIMAWIASGRIAVPQLGQRAFEVGMSYVAAATRQSGRRVHGWDAIHMFQACQLARRLGHPVVIATADADFATLIEVFPEFGALVEIRDYAVE